MRESVYGGLKWRKSSTCADNACIEVAQDGDDVLVRNSDRPTDITRHTPSEWDAFVAGVKNGDFDL